MAIFHSWEAKVPRVTMHENKAVEEGRANFGNNFFVNDWRDEFEYEVHPLVAPECEDEKKQGL